MNIIRREDNSKLSDLSNKLEKLIDLFRNKTPTQIQLKTWPVLLSRKNCLVVALTGTGKTEAVLLQIFSLISNVPKIKGLRVIYITPLRSLNRDLLRRIEHYITMFGLKVKVRHGDTSAYERHKIVGDPPDVLITTPETFGILLTSKSFMNNLKTVECVVVDELHELLGNKRGVQLCKYPALRSSLDQV